MAHGCYEGFGQEQAARLVNFDLQLLALEMEENTEDTVGAARYVCSVRTVRRKNGPLASLLTLSGIRQQVWEVFAHRCWVVGSTSSPAHPGRWLHGGGPFCTGDVLRPGVP